MLDIEIISELKSAAAAGITLEAIIKQDEMFPGQILSTLVGQLIELSKGEGQARNESFVQDIADSAGIIAPSGEAAASGSTT